MSQVIAIAKMAMIRIFAIASAIAFTIAITVCEGTLIPYVAFQILSYPNPILN